MHVELVAKIHYHRNIKYAVLEGTHQDHGIQLLALHRTPKKSHPGPESDFQMLPETRQTWSCAPSLGSHSVPRHALGEELFPDINLNQKFYLSPSKKDTQARGTQCFRGGPRSATPCTPGIVGTLSLFKGTSKWCPIPSIMNPHDSLLYMKEGVGEIK